MLLERAEAPLRLAVRDLGACEDLDARATAERPAVRLLEERDTTVEARAPLAVAPLAATVLAIELAPEVLRARRWEVLIALATVFFAVRALTRAEAFLRRDLARGFCERDRGANGITSAWASS